MLLTIVMPAYNAAKYIGTAIEAIVNQTFAEWKLIVINDNSGDETGAIVRKWCLKDARITLVDNAENLRVARTMNKGLAMVDTPYFARIDSDDIPLPTHLQEIIAVLEANKTLAACGSQVITIDGNGAFRRKWNYEQTSDWLKISSIFACPFLQSSVIIRTEILQSLGGYRPEMELVEDYELWLRVLKSYPVANIGAYTMQYRIHDTNMSETNKAKILALLESLYREYQDAYPIDLTHLDLHARMEFGDWSNLKQTEYSAIKDWLSALKKQNAGQGFYSTNLYQQVLKKYFTNAYLKIATQNSGALRWKALLQALFFSPKYCVEIFQRKKENSQPN